MYTSDYKEKILKDVLDIIHSNANIDEYTARLISIKMCDIVARVLMDIDFKNFDADDFTITLDTIVEEISSMFNKI